MLRLFDFITSYLQNFENLPSFSSLASMGPAWIFGGLGTVGMFLFGLSLGRTRTVVSLLSIYIAFAFDRIFPYLSQLKSVAGNSVESYWLRLGLFFGIYLAVFLILNFSFIKKRVSSAEYSLFGIVLLTFFQFGFLLSIVFNMLPEVMASKWSFGFYDYFATKQAMFIWAVVPLPAILFMGKK